ncbi:MAG: hypothetical protein MK101_02430 [Phycisphaerales bacterium]|nr:hypothetical protein [Phycisphaerales bacterium]
MGAVEAAGALAASIVSGGGSLHAPNKSAAGTNAVNSVRFIAGQMANSVE